MKSFEQIEKYMAVFKEFKERIEPIIQQVETAFPNADKQVKLFFIGVFGSVIFNEIAQRQGLSL